MDDSQRLRAMRKLLLEQLAALPKNSNDQAELKARILHVLGYNERMIGLYLLRKADFDENAELLEFPQAEEVKPVSDRFVIAPLYRVDDVLKINEVDATEYPEGFVVTHIMLDYRAASGSYEWIYWGSYESSKVGTILGPGFPERALVKAKK